jgi:exopolysaccharide biosynthesis polyprenyl glycosylphosphotransferase
MSNIEEKSLQIKRRMFWLDVVLTICSFLIAYFVGKSFFKDVDTNISSHLAMMPLILAFLLFFLSFFNSYRGYRSASLIFYFFAVFKAVILSSGIFIALLYILKIEYINRYIFILFAVIEIVVLFFGRFISAMQLRRAFKKKENFLKVLIIGTGQRAQIICRKLMDNSEWGVDIIGHLDPDPERVGLSVYNNPVIGTVKHISKILKENVVDEVIVAITRNMMSDAEDIALACEEEGIKLRMMADVFDLQVARWSLVEVGEIPLLTLEPVALDEDKLFIKRVLDLTLTLLCMPILLPVMALIALGIKFDSKGPVFFIQERVGLKKRLFPLLKFRSMVVGSEEMLSEIEHLNEAEGPIFKIKDDPRVTKFGRFIRKTSLDELPQLFNVIKGDMSLVGPRPMSIRDVDLFDKGIQRKRFSVKPGITCLWQISGRSNLPFSKWLELDLKYIETWSLYLDFKILLKTIPVVFKGSGAV